MCYDEPYYHTKQDAGYDEDCMNTTCEYNKEKLEVLEDDMQGAKSAAEKLIQILYIKGKFDRNSLDNIMGELCDCLGVKHMPAEMPQVEAIKEKTLIEDWLAFVQDMQKLEQNKQ